jgi:hypothetical protein
MAPQPPDPGLQLFWRYLMQLQITDPQKFHVIAKQLGIGPYDSHGGADVGRTGEFTEFGSGTPGLGQYAGYESRF